jgi:cytochrome c oxidase subunit 2
MLGEVVWVPESASTSARAVDGLTIFLMVVCGAVGLLVAFLLFYFSIKYRRRPGNEQTSPISANVPLELFWTLTPLVIFLGIFFWGAVVYFDAYRPPDDAILVYGVGKQWMWKFQHPGGQREINELHVPANTPVKVLLISEDVIHSFFVPAFRLHMDVLPGRYNSVWFEATEPGSYHLFCSQYCGTNHADMIGTVHVMEPDKFRRWLTYRAEGGAALEGRKVFLKYRCNSCHNVERSAPCPSLEELYLTPVTLRDGTKVIADEPYLRESVYYPGAKIVFGYEDIMPNYRGQMSEEEVFQLIAFIKSLGRGQTPSRVERYRRPTGAFEINPPKKMEP